MTTFEGLPVSEITAARIKHLLDENNQLKMENAVLINKLLSETKECNEEKKNVNCLKMIVSKQIAKIQAFKNVFWRLYWK